MTENPALKSATAVLLDYVEDEEDFAYAMNESIDGRALLDKECNFLREPTAMEFLLMRALLPKDGAARFLAAFQSVIEQEFLWPLEEPEDETAEAM